VTTTKDVAEQRNVNTGHIQFLCGCGFIGGTKATVWSIERKDTKWQSQ
jgi:hypothetical protein